MSEKHTPGHLILEHGADIVTFEDGRIMDVASVYCHAIDGRSEANAERLVACWNACQGIDTADLKSGSVSIIQKLHDDVAQRVLEQRDELLAALQGIIGYFDSGNSVDVSQATIKAGSDEVKAARAAIAKVDGVAK